jgi:hypothetical protein
MTPVEKAAGALFIALLSLAVIAALVNMAIAATEMIERRRKQRRARG